ncbi:MAG: hypothetical protein IKQ46_00150 [Bacteroidales bacterium]|nr:hypothetical protein [Bacteroidales bacterium]
MAKIFNTSVTCNPTEHYMVDTTQKMKVFERLINNRNYFTINYARQFGKSTSLNWILRNMSDRYLVIPASFERSSAEDWISTDSFCRYFCKKMIEPLNKISDCKSFWINVMQQDKLDFDILADKITEFCKSVDKKVVLTIDEVDKSLDNQLFLNFLSMLRNMYLDREKFEDYNYTFWSVVLAGVYDVKSMKVKIRPDDEHRYNSPWNVAAEYKLDMTFNPQEISTMLTDYENDYHIGFNINEISEEIYKYTSGYPVLVSGICKIIDEQLNKNWTKNSVQKAAKIIIGEKTNLSESMTSNLELYPKLKTFIRALLMENFSVFFDINNPTMDFARMFSIIKKNSEGRVEIHNLIFQQILINYFISENELARLAPGVGLKIFIDKNGDLNMPLIINRFKDLVSKKHDKEDEFLEREGRFMFICFLKPIINGTGFYYSEPENDDSSRMDLVVTYNRKEYVIELKIWHGTEYEISGRDQLSEYLETRNLSEGYLVTFSFLKEKVIQEKPEWIEHNGKKIYEAIV